jgi:threonine dehydratase
MPETASPAKVRATQDYGAEVVLHGSPAECLARCLELVEEHDLTFISSYDNDDLMTGHASLGLEILEQAPDTDAIFVGIGGGGMAGGIAKAVAAGGRDVRLFGVEPEGAPAMRRSLDAGRPVALERVETIADGLAAPTAGELCYALVRDHFADVLLVPDARIMEAVRLLMIRCKLFAEPAGAAALAGLLAFPNRVRSGSRVVCVVSGGNFALDRLKGLL